MQKTRLDHVQKDGETCSELPLSAQKELVAEHAMTNMKQNTQELQVHPLVKRFVEARNDCINHLLGTRFIDTQIENSDKHRQGTPVNIVMILKDMRS
jgi:cell fate (sporulation/competence/biofilm development) regulator YlbF (YheA/YmcA/DUF963 family)